MIYLGHEAWTSPDGNTLYLGGQPTAAVQLVHDRRHHRVARQGRRRRCSARSRGGATASGWPDERPTYALHSEESVVGPDREGCLSEELNPIGGAAQPWLSDVTNPRQPRMRVSR